MNRRIMPKKTGVFRYPHFAGILLGLFTLLFRIMMQNRPEKIEYGYARVIYPYIADALGMAGRAAPPSCPVSEIAIMAVFAAALIWFSNGICQWIRGRRSLGKTVAGMAVTAAAAGGFAFFLFTAVWGLNYYREPFFKTLVPEPSGAVTSADYSRMLADMVEVITHALDAGIQDMHHLTVMDQAVTRSVKDMVSLTAIAHMPEPPPVKALYLSRFMNVFGIAGIFLPVFMEPHVNPSMLPWEQITVIAHEKAHFFGFASEQDASLIAYASCLASASPCLRYAAGLTLLDALYPYVDEDEWKKQVWEGLPEKARKDREASFKRLQANRERHRKLIKMQRRINHVYLKSNHQKKGVAAYGAALPCLAAWWMKNRETVLKPVQSHHVAAFKSAKSAPGKINRI